MQITGMDKDFIFFLSFPSPITKVIDKTFPFALVGQVQGGWSPNYIPKPEPWLCSSPRWCPSCNFSWVAKINFAISIVNSSKDSCLSWFVSRSSMMSFMTLSSFFSSCG